MLKMANDRQSLKKPNTTNKTNIQSSVVGINIFGLAEKGIAPEAHCYTSFVATEYKLSRREGRNRISSLTFSVAVDHLGW